MFTGSVVSATLLSSSQRGGITFTPVVVSNSTYSSEIFGLSAVLESVDGTADALWSCSIFLIGNNNEIVAATRPVRSARLIIWYYIVCEQSTLSCLACMPPTIETNKRNVFVHAAMITSNCMDHYVNIIIQCRKSGATTNSLVRVNSSNVTNLDYQPLLMTSITVTGALLASLGGCSVSGMSMRLNVSIVEPGIKGTFNHSKTSIGTMA